MPLGGSIPGYASNKYRNTVELLERAKRLKEGVERNEGSLGAIGDRRFNSSYQSLLLKEQVLGYLEDLTKGRFHREPLDKDQLRQYTDWVLSDSPARPFPFERHPKAYARLNWLRGYIQNSGDETKAKREILRSLYLESRPEIPIEKVENLVLAGGGAKALSLAGAVRSLEEQSVTPQLKRIAGTSGGAIIAMAYAVGYDADELSDLVMDNQFGLFTLGSRFDNGILNQWAHHFNRDKPHSMLHVLSDNSLAHTYHKHLMQSLAEMIQKTLDPRLKNIRQVLGDERRHAGRNLAKVINRLPQKDVYYHAIVDTLTTEQQLQVDNEARAATMDDMGDETLLGAVTLYKKPSQAIVSAMRHRTGQDLVRGFFSDVLYEKLKTYPKADLREALYGPEFRENKQKTVRQADLRNIDFIQLQRLHELHPDKVKELHISMSILKDDWSDRFNGVKPNFYRHASASFDNDEFNRLPVVDAVRISMNIPPIYPRYKFKLNDRVYYGSDGGIKSNISLATFDQKHAPEKTIGVFYKTSAQLGAAMDVNRMLVIPRSEDDIERDMRLAEAKDLELKKKQEPLEKIWNSLEHPVNEKDPKIARLKEKRERLLDARRRLGGEIAGYRNELENLRKTDQSVVSRWLSDPGGEFGHLFSRYLNSKSNDDLSKTHNLRRLVMVNTRDVDTTNFKMPDEEKRLQISYGKKAMGSLLSGTYCLENHFYYHHFHSIEQMLLENELQPWINSIEMNETVDPAMSVPENHQRVVISEDPDRDVAIRASIDKPIAKQPPAEPDNPTSVTRRR